MTWKTFLLPSFVAAFLAILGCSPSGLKETSPDVFIFARASDAQKLDPADIDDGESANTLAQMCEGLVRFKSGTLDIEPCLAEEYEIANGGLTYRFKLREGVSFHDGTPLTAETALFTFHRQMDPGHPGHLDDASFAYWNYLYQDILKVEAVEEMVIEFTLANPNSSLLRSLAIFPAFLVSPTALDTYGEAFQRNPVGTGPFKFVDWRPNQAITMERNDDYWGEKPFFKRLVMTVVPENTVRLLKLQAGEIGGMDGLDPSELEGLADDPSIRVYQEDGLNVGYLAFNLETERLSNLEIRRAIAMAIDRETLNRVAFRGAGKAADFPIPPGFVGYPQSMDGYQYDPEAAKAIIAKYADQFEQPLEIKVMNAARPYFPDPETVATVLKGQLEKAGIPVEIVTSDFKAHLNNLRNGDFEAGLIGWVGDNGDTDNFLSVFFSSWAAEKGSATNYSFYKVPEMDALLREGRIENRTVERSRIYEDVLKMWKRDLPIIPLVHGNNLAALRSDYEGFELQKIGDLRLAWIQVAK